GRREAGAYLQQCMGSRCVCVALSIAGQHRHTQDKQPWTQSNGKVEKSINLTVMFWTMGGNWNPCMHGEDTKTPCRKTLSQELNPGPSCYKATELPTVPPCSPINSFGLVAGRGHVIW
ncbi:hypothetical protein ILYODFUR_002414, partial [Ilyodon furcidens]